MVFGELCLTLEIIPLNLEVLLAMVKMWNSKFKFISIVKPKYLTVLDFGMEVSYKKILVCENDLLSLGNQLKN